MSNARIHGLSLRLAVAIGGVLVSAWSALAWSGTSIVASPGHAVLAVSDWPQGVLELVNDPLRTHGWNPFFSEWPNDVNYYGFKVRDAEAADRLITKLAAIKGTNMQLRLSPAREARHLGFTTDLGQSNENTAIFAIGSQAAIDHWFQHLREVEPGVRSFGVHRYREAPAALPPTLTLFLGSGVIDLKKLKVPANVQVAADIAKSPSKEDSAAIKAIEEWIKARASKQGVKPETRSSPSSSQPMLPGSVATNVIVLGTEALPAPGVYAARPWSGLVLVPEPADQAMIHQPSSSTKFSGRSIAPPLHLEQMDRR